jgi:hypothetical protein
MTWHDVILSKTKDLAHWAEMLRHIQHDKETNRPFPIHSGSNNIDRTRDQKSKSEAVQAWPRPSLKVILHFFENFLTFEAYN